MLGSRRPLPRVGAIPEDRDGTLSHVAPDGGVAMVDVGSKAITERLAHARALVALTPATAKALRDATLVKGDAFVTAQLAGIMAAKQTASLIPLAHPHFARERRRAFLVYGCGKARDRRDRDPRTRRRASRWKRWSRPRSPRSPSTT